MEESQFSAVQELDAMKAVAQALSKLDESAVRRVLRWANDAFSPKAGADMTRLEATLGVSNSGPTASVGELRSQFDSLADFYTAADPKTGADKALVVGYWVVSFYDDDDRSRLIVLRLEVPTSGFSIGDCSGIYRDSNF